MAKNVAVKYNDNDRVIVNALKENENGMTLAEINEYTGKDFKPGTLTSVVNKGLIDYAPEKRVVEKMGKAKVSTYELIDATPAKDAKGKDFNYSDTEKAILKALGEAEAPMTLAELSVATGIALKSGNINALVNTKGNVAINKDAVEVEKPRKSEVRVYVFLADVPADAETPTAE